MEPKKRKILVIFGGRSEENIISLISGLFVTLSLSKEKNDIYSLYIKEDGALCNKKDFPDIIDKVLEDYSKKIIPDGLDKKDEVKKLILKTYCGLEDEKNDILKFMKIISNKIDIVFPVFHGRNGEDGSIQGLLDFFDIPYVGSGIATSAIGIDKDLSKTICRGLDIPVLEDSIIYKNNWKNRRRKILDEMINKHKFPIFIKPATLGSSIGIRRVKKGEELEKAIDYSFTFDKKLLIENELDDARELTISILGKDGEIILSEVGEFNKKGVKYFDFDAKYNETSKEGMIPAKIKKEIKFEIEKYTKILFKKLGGEGYIRVDYFFKDNKVYLNEINTISGFENGGTFLKIWESIGYCFSDFLEKIISLEEK